MGEGLDVLFFEFASESRLAIVRVLCTEKLKMQDIARKLDLTATEASRQLQRLSKANLIERLPDSTYQTSQFGRLMLTLSGSMDFVFKNKRFFSEHDVWKLPASFIYRLSELQESTLEYDLNECIVRWEQIVKSAEVHIWVMTPEVMPLLSRATGEKLAGGLKVKSLVGEHLSERSKVNITTGANVERRYLSNIPAILLISEKEASISMPLYDGNMHHASFFAKDEASLKWVNELFLYHWDRAERFV